MDVEEILLVSRWALQSCLSFAVWGSHNDPLFLLKPESKKRSTTYSSSPSKDDFSCLQRPPNLITYNLTIFNCLLLSTLAAIVHCCRFANYCQHNVRWTELHYASPISRPPPWKLGLVLASTGIEPILSLLKKKNNAKPALVLIFH